jgi:hypothetical protein
MAGSGMIAQEPGVPSAPVKPGAWREAGWKRFGGVLTVEEHSDNHVQRIELQQQPSSLQYSLSTIEHGHPPPSLGQQLTWKRVDFAQEPRGGRLTVDLSQAECAL